MSDESEARWRFLAPAPEPRRLPDGPTRDEMEWLDAAWQRLLVAHTPFRATLREEFLTLTAALRRLEELFLSHPDLEPYYDECFRDDYPVDPGAPPPPGPLYEPPAPLPIPYIPAPEARVRHVVMLQTQLMEDVFYGLRLDRYANAPDNRGWMNLFRRWGRSPTFNRHFNDIRTTFTAELVEFYRLYVRYLDAIDRQPVPHHWDDGRDAYGATSLPSAVDVWRWGRMRAHVEARRGGAAAPEPPRFAPVVHTESRAVPGVLLDSGIMVLRPHVDDTARGNAPDTAGKAGFDTAGTGAPAAPPAGDAGRAGSAGSAGSAGGAGGAGSAGGGGATAGGNE